MNPVAKNQTFASQWLPEMPKLQLPNMKTIEKIAPVALAIFAAASLPGADAGPLFEIGCWGACSAAVLVNPLLAPWYPTCMEFCAILGFAPTV